MSNHQYSHIKKIVKDYVISYGVIQAENSSCDLIDFFKIGDDKYGLYLADVADTGEPAVKVMNKLQGIINKHSFECLENAATSDKLDPAEIVREINREICKDKFSKYITLIYGILDFKQNKLDYAIAGYYPNPILIEGKDQAKYLFGQGYPLGLLPGATFERFTVDVKPGQGLMFFSDGIMRFFMLSEEAGEKDQKLLELVADPQIEISDVLHKLKLNFETLVNDDIVILNIRRNNL